MNFLRRRLSDSSFVANLPNGYMMDLQRPDNSTSSPVSPALERKQQAPQQVLASSTSTSGTSLFSSISNAVKQTTQAAAGLVEPTGPPAPPVVLKPKILLVIDDAHTDWAKYFRGKKVNKEYEIRVEQSHQDATFPSLCPIAPPLPPTPTSSEHLRSRSFMRLIFPTSDFRTNPLFMAYVDGIKMVEVVGEQNE
ncbi:synapsin-3-like, partial [Rhinoderma darwinii]|uniref:synapsin-3-like n=1 Tax=Rhinoderma darwinii TaxID=43563 RepID=UPI003F66BC31